MTRQKITLNFPSPPPKFTTVGALEVGTMFRLYAGGVVYLRIDSPAMAIVIKIPLHSRAKTHVRLFGFSSEIESEAKVRLTRILGILSA